MVIRRRLEPLRYEIRKRLLELFRRGRYQPGDKIPTESELSELLDVSRSSLREGLHLLEEERILRTKHGAGRFLLSLPGDLKIEITRLQSVTEMLAGYGIEGTTKVVRVRELPAEEETADALDLPAGSPVLHIERLRCAEEVAIIYSIDIINRKLIPGTWQEDDFAGSLLKYLEETCDIVLDHSHAAITAVSSDEIREAEIDTKAHIPWILLIQTNYDAVGKPIIFSKDYHRSDYISFRVRRFRN